MTPYKTSRRQLIKTAALATAALAAPPFIRHSRAAGKLSIAAWDHFSGQGPNDSLRKLVQEWGDKNRVEVSLDFITSVGDKLYMTGVAEARAKAGHDVFWLWQWYTSILRDSLEPLDDLAAENERLYGEYLPIAQYLCKPDGHWRSLPGITGSQSFPSNSRLDLIKEHCNYDVTEVFPADVRKRNKQAVDAFDWDKVLVLAEQCKKAGVPFGQPIGQTSDSPIWLGPLFASFGAFLADEKGDITVNTPQAREAMDYMKRLAQFMPDGIYAWDDAGNNKHMLGGKGAWIMNPPSVWAVGTGTGGKPGTAPEVAAKMWHHDAPRGPKGRYRGGGLYNMGVFSFSSNKSAAKDLVRWLTKKEQVDRQLPTGRGYDLPMNKGLYANPIWDTEGPPKGTLYNYPIRGDEILFVSGMPAPHALAAKMYTQATLPQMVARYTSGQNSMDEAIKWAEREIEDFKRV